MITKEMKIEGYICRTLLASDCSELFKLLSDEEVARNLNMTLHKNREDTEKLLAHYLEGLQEGTKIPYAIIDKMNDNFVGVFLIKLDIYNPDSYEFTLYLNKNSWGKSISTKLLPLIMDIAFKQIKTKNLRAYVMERNITSWKGLEKYHFILEKTFEVEGLPDKIKSYLMTVEQYKLLQH